MKHRILLVAAAAALLAPFARAQGTAARPTPRFSVESAVGFDGEVGIGPGYHVELAELGFAFVPHLGTEAPERAPLAYAVEEIRRGERLLWRAGDDAPARATDGRRAAWDLDAGLQMRLELGSSGAELRFRFDERPPGVGDLRVLGRVATGMPLESAHPDAGLAFAAPLAGAHVRVGGVTGVDADGARAGGGIALRGEELELTLPAAFVEAARYPLVLDPLIEPQFELEPDLGRYPDVEYRTSFAAYCTVWSSPVSAAESHVYLAEVDAGSGSSTLHQLASDGYHSHPRVAVPRSDKITPENAWVVWQHGPSFLGPWSVEAYVHGVGGGG